MEAFWNQRNLQVADEVFAPDATAVNDPSTPPGPEGQRLAASTVFSGFPDFQVSIEKLVGEGNKVAAYYTRTGTHEGSFLGIAPTGKKISWTEMSLFHFNEDGKVEASWVETDLMAMMQQMGVIPSQG